MLKRRVGHNQLVLNCNNFNDGDEDDEKQIRQLMNVGDVIQRDVLNESLESSELKPELQLSMLMQPTPNKKQENTVYTIRLSEYKIYNILKFK